MLVAGLATLAAAAVIESVRNGETGPPGRDRRVSEVDRAEERLRAALTGEGVRGVLLLAESRPEGCRLRAFRLPELVPGTAPTWEACAFSVPPDGSRAAEGGTVWSSDGELGAVEAGGGVDLVAWATGQARRFPGARAPAFKPDDSLTFVRTGDLVEWSRVCRRGGPAVTFPGRGGDRRCPSIVWTEARLTAAAPALGVLAPRRAAIVTVAWLDSERFFAVLNVGDRDALVAVDRATASRPWIVSTRLSELRVSPRGDFVSVLAAGGDLHLFDRVGRRVAAPIPDVRGAAWAPDGAWLAALHGRFVAFYRPGQTRTRLPELPIRAYDLAWTS
jgi:hypothetical protein